MTYSIYISFVLSPLLLFSSPCQLPSSFVIDFSSLSIPIAIVIMIRMNLCCLGIKTLVLMVITKDGYHVNARTRGGRSKAGKNYIPVVFPDPEEENPCTGSGEAFLKTNELRSFRNGGSLTCQEAKEEKIPQTGGVSPCCCDRE